MNLLNSWLKPARSTMRWWRSDASPTALSSEHESGVYRAIQDDNVAKLLTLMSGAHWFLPGGAHVLLIAAEARSRLILRFLLTVPSIDVNFRDALRFDRTALRELAWSGDLEMVRLLAAAGARIDERDPR